MRQLMTNARGWIASAAGAIAASGVAATAAGAQIVRGEVRETSTKQPIVGAAIVFRDSLGIVAGFTRSDESGAFMLRVPVTAFVLRATRVGFAPDSVSTAGAEPTDTLNVLLDMRALPVTLNPVMIKEQKRRIRDTRVLGLNLHTMSTDLITPAQLAVTARGAQTYLDAIRTMLPAGISASQRSQCVIMNRGTRISGQQACAMVIVDGVRVDDPRTVVDLVRPQWLDHAIFVRAADAGVRFGTGAAGGVLLLFTTFGSYALPARP